jgi:hypothetical protein
MKEINMPIKALSRTTILAVTTLFACSFVTPLATAAQDAPLAVPAMPSWDETSGYGSVEAIRAAAAEPLVASDVTTSQVPPDVRWAPAVVTAPAPTAGANSEATAVYEALNYGPSVDPGGVPSVGPSRVDIALKALASGDIGGMQEEALLAVVASAKAWDATSGYGAVEASRAVVMPLLAPSGR